MRPSPATERLTAQLGAEELLLLPLALFHGGIGRRQVTRQREDEAHGKLGDAHAVGARRVHHDDPARAGGGHVDVVHAGARAGDDAKCRSGVDDGRGNLGRAADDDGVGIRDVTGKLFGRPASTGIDVPAFRAQEVERGCRKVVGDYDFQCWFRKESVGDALMMSAASALDAAAFTNAKYNLWLAPEHDFVSAAEMGHREKQRIQIRKAFSESQCLCGS